MKKSILILSLLVLVSCYNSFGKKKSNSLKRIKIDIFTNAIIEATKNDKKDCNGATCELVEYAFKIPHGLRKASQWILYKGKDGPQPCFILVVERGKSKSYYKGKVLCSSYCGVGQKEMFVRGDISEELKRECDQHELEELTKEEADVFVNGKQEDALINRIIISQDVVNQASYVSGDDAPIYFHALVGWGEKPKTGAAEVSIMFDSLNKDGKHYLGKKVFIAGSNQYLRGIVKLD